MKKNASSKLLWVMLVIGIGIFILGAVKRKSGDVFRSAVTNGRPADRNTIILTTAWSRPIPVNDRRKFNGAVVEGYAEEILVRDADHPEKFFPLGPHKNGDVTAMKSFQLSVNGNKVVKGPIVFRYWE